MRWDRLTVGLGLGYALLAWSLGYGAVLPELRDELHMSASIAAVHGSLFGVCLIVFALFGSRFLAATSNRRLLAMSVTAMVGGGVLFGVGRTAAVTLGGAGLCGIGAALLVIVVPSIVFAHQHHAPTQAMATLNAFPMASATLLPLAVSLAGVVGISWRFSYLGPVIVIALAIVFTVGRSRVPRASSGSPVALGQLFRVPHFARRWCLLVCGVLVEIGTGIWAASIMHRQGGASESVAASLTVGFFIGMAIGRISLTTILRRIEPTRVLATSFLGSLAALGPFLLGPGLVGRVAGLTMLGLFLAPVYPLSITRLFELHDDTAALGRAAALASGFGVTFGPLILGALADAVGLGWGTFALPVFLIAGLIAMSTGRAAAQTPVASPDDGANIAV